MRLHTKSGSIKKPNGFRINAFLSAREVFSGRAEHKAHLLGLFSINHIVDLVDNELAYPNAQWGAGAPLYFFAAPLFSGVNKFVDIAFGLKHKSLAFAVI
jgi:hypothetical protein